MALLLIRTAEIAARATWRNLAHNLDSIQLHTYDTGGCTVSKRARLTRKQRSGLEAVELAEPPRYYQSNLDDQPATVSAPNGPAGV